MPTIAGGLRLGSGTNRLVTAGNPASDHKSRRLVQRRLVLAAARKIKLNPGVYYVNGGNFNVGGAVQMNGTGVTIVLTGSASSSYNPKYATVTIGNGAQSN